MPEKAGLISGTPEKALAFMRANNLPAPVFNDLAFGDYRMWAGQPEYKVFVDPRVEVYPREIWDNCGTLITAGPGWGQIAARHGFRTLMLDRNTQAALILAAGASPLWRREYDGPDAVIFTRCNSPCASGQDTGVRRAID